MNPNPDKCPRCGAARTGEFKYCPQCGANYDALNKIKTPKPQKETVRRRRWEWAALAGVVLLTTVIFIVYTAAKENIVPAQPPAPQQSQPQQQATNPAATMPLGDDFNSIVQRGHQLMDSRQFAQAIPMYERALTLDSLQPDIMVDLGACYHAVGDFEEATFQFRRALAQQPNHAIAIFNMGVVAMTVSDTASARQWWTKFLEVAPDSPQAPTVRERLKNL